MQIFNTVPDVPLTNAQLHLSRKKSSDSKPPSCSERPLTLFHAVPSTEKRESLLPRAGWYVETSLLPPWLAVNILAVCFWPLVSRRLCVLLCLVWFHCWERKAQVSGQEAEPVLSTAQQELGSGISQGPSFIGRSHRSSSFPWLGLELLLEGVTCSIRLCL